jgi:hypothetical protein
MGEVVGIKGETELQKPDMVADVIAFLRKHADQLEKGSERPAHKAVLILYEDLGDKTRLVSAFCNTTVTERVGIMFMALNDMANTD